MDNDAEQGLRPSNTSREVTRERIYTPADHQRHYAPLNRELRPEDAKQFGWKAENGTVQTYQHGETLRHIHIDGPSGQFYDQKQNPITQMAALDRALGPNNHHADSVRLRESLQQRRADKGIGLGL